MRQPEFLDVDPRELHSNRHELLKLIEELSAACPEFRFGQLVLNLAFLAREDGDRLAWDLEDAEFIEAARKHLADWYSSHGKFEDVPRSSTVRTQT